jgi:hypothetical protein
MNDKQKNIEKAIKFLRERVKTHLEKQHAITQLSEKDNSMFFTFIRQSITKKYETPSNRMRFPPGKEDFVESNIQKNLACSSDDITSLITNGVVVNPTTLTDF